MQVLTAPEARFGVLERDDYTLALARDVGSDKPEELYLYGVIVSGPFKTERVYVLAESEEGAADQARCACKLESYHSSEAVSKETSVYAERLPLVIRGWSRTRF